MKLLVLGASGLLGSNVVHAARAADHDVAGTVHSTRPALEAPLHALDLRDDTRVAAVLDDVEPDVAVNCAAATDVDACEVDPDRARAINGTAAGRVATHCARRDVRLVHVSTDYVFDGTAGGRYAEDDEPAPVQTYGHSKLAGERAVLGSDATALVVRASFLYGVHRGTDSLAGFPAWVRDRMLAGTETPLFTDQRVTPTRAGQAADAVLDLLSTAAEGVVHVAARSCVTPYRFGNEIRRRIDLPASLLVEGSTDDVDRAATRPVDTCLDVDRVESLLDRAQPTLSADLDAIEDALVASYIA